METNLLPFFVWNYQLDEALEGVANGDDSVGHIILTHFVNSIDSGKSPDPRTMDFILGAFKGMLTEHMDGKSVNFASALKMNKSKGRPNLTPQGKHRRALQYGGEVAKLMSAGSTNLKAMEQVAKKYKRSPKTIQGYYTLFNKIVEG